MADSDRELPGVFANLARVSTVDYGDDVSQRRTPQEWDLDSAPLARLLVAALGLGGDKLECMRDLAADDRDGPIHLVHLLAACEWAAHRTGGGLPGPAFIGNDLTGLRMIADEVGGDHLKALVGALRIGGLAAATSTARQMSHQDRFNVLDALMSFWEAPVTGLRLGLSNEHLAIRPT